MDSSVNRRRLAASAAALLAAGGFALRPGAAQGAPAGQVIAAADYGLAGDGVTDDSAALQAALDAAETQGGGLVMLGAGAFRCNVTIGSRVTLLGQGPRATTLVAVAGSGRPVIEGRGFAGLTGTDYQFPETRGANYVGLIGLCVDGDRAANVAGRGVQIWGRSHVFRDLIVQNCVEDGIFLEFTTHDAGEISDDLEGFFTNIKTIRNGGSGWVHRGPHDSILSNFVTFSNDGWGFRSEIRSGSYNGGISGTAWNSWLNGLGSFQFGASPGFLSDSAAIGPNQGTGIELMEDSGSARLTGIVIGGHEIGLLLRGNNHIFNGVVSTSISYEPNRSGIGIILDNAGLCLIDVTGIGNEVAIAVAREVGPNMIRGRFNVPEGGQLLVGSVFSTTTVDLAQIGPEGVGTITQIPTLLALHNTMEQVGPEATSAVEPPPGTQGAATPDAGTPESGTPESGTPESGTPESGTPEVSTPEAASLIATPIIPPGDPPAGTPLAGTPPAGTAPATPTA